MNQNDAYPDNIHFTQEEDKYEGYTIECAVSKSTGEPGKWMGHFRAYKDDVPTLRSSIANLQESDSQARQKAIDVAKWAIDEVIAAEK